MRVLCIVPHIGRKERSRYIRSWQMEPLAFATLAGATPDDVELVLYDERLEEINFDDAADLAAINIETYTAKRGYEIAREFRRRNVPTVFGGYHATLAPHEAVCYGDSVVIGPAENSWATILDTIRHNQPLQPWYRRAETDEMKFAMPRRDIFAGKPYFGITCVETGRGCPLRCNFCSIAAATRSTFIRRPIHQIIEEIRRSGKKKIFFVDDNIIGHIPSAKELFRNLIPLNIRWVSQGTVNMARDEELLDLMVESGCKGVLIGFESLKRDTLMLMNKPVNANVGDYETAIRKIHSKGLAIYGTFIFGYDTDTLNDYERTAEWAIEQDLFIAAFNHLLPFPSTPLYQEFQKQGQLRYPKGWWLNPAFRYNEVPFYPKNCSHEELREACMAARRKFYGMSGILRRFNREVAMSSLPMASTYFWLNLLLGREVEQKNGLPLGNETEHTVPFREAVYA